MKEKMKKMNEYTIVDGRMICTKETIERMRELALKYGYQYDTLRGYFKTHKSIKKVENELLKNKIQKAQNNVKCLVVKEKAKLKKLEEDGKKLQLALLCFPFNIKLPPIEIPQCIVDEMMMYYRKNVLCWNEYIQKGVIEQSDVYNPKRCEQKINQHLQQKFDGIDVETICDILSKLIFPKTFSKTIEECEYDYLVEQLKLRWDEVLEVKRDV